MHKCECIIPNYFTINDCVLTLQVRIHEIQYSEQCRTFWALLNRACEKGNSTFVRVFYPLQLVSACLQICSYTLTNHVLCQHPCTNYSVLLVHGWQNALLPRSTAHGSVVQAVVRRELPGTHVSSVASSGEAVGIVVLADTLTRAQVQQQMLVCFTLSSSTWIPARQDI